MYSVADVAVAHGKLFLTYTKMLLLYIRKYLCYYYNARIEGLVGITRLGLFLCTPYGAGAGLSFHRTHACEVIGMPRRCDVPCKHPGCPKLIPYGQMYCEEHKALHQGDRKGSSARGYNAAWQRESKKFLMQHKLCVMCLEEKKITEATVVDHIIPHRGDNDLFWDRNNWQPLCKHHHDVKTMTEDRHQEYRY